MDINEIYETVQLELFKDQSGNVYPPDDFNLRLKSVDIDFMKIRYGLPEEYQPGRPMPRMGWQITQKITDDLSPLIVNMGVDTPPLNVDAKGFANLPEDYMHQSTLYTPYGDIEVVPDDEFSSRERASLKKPTTKNPICRFLNGKIQFSPKNIHQVYFTYLKKPVPGFWDYTVSQGVPVFLPVGEFHDGTVLPVGTPSRTQDLIWPDAAHTDIINLLVGYASKSLRSVFMAQGTESRKIKGQ